LALNYFDGKLIETGSFAVSIAQNLNWRIINYKIADKVRMHKFYFRRILRKS